MYCINIDNNNNDNDNDNNNNNTSRVSYQAVFAGPEIAIEDRRPISRKFHPEIRSISGADAADFPDFNRFDNQFGRSGD